MNKRRITLWLVLLFTGMASQAGAEQATLVIPEELDVERVDNIKHSSSFFSGGDTTLKLAPGQHKVVVEYDAIFDVSNDDHERIQSEPFQVTFKVEAGKQYFIKLPSLKSINSARKFANKPVVEIMNRSTNRAVATKVTYREFDGTFSTQSNEAVVAGKPVTVNKIPPYVPSPPVVTLPAENTATAQQVEQGATGNMPLKMLEYWWQKANAQQRKRFIESR